MPTQKFRIKGLKAEDETSLEARLRALGGVLFVAASHGAQCAEVEFEDDEVTAAEIARAIADAGYPAEEAG